MRLRQLLKFVLLAAAVTLAGCTNFSSGAKNHVVFESDIAENSAKPWTDKTLDKHDGAMVFVVFGDRTGLHYPGKIRPAVEKINRSNPDFVVSVGDHIEGSQVVVARGAELTDVVRVDPAHLAAVVLVPRPERLPAKACVRPLGATPRTRDGCVQPPELALVVRPLPPEAVPEGQPGGRGGPERHAVVENRDLGPAADPPEHMVPRPTLDELRPNGQQTVDRFAQETFRIVEHHAHVEARALGETPGEAP